MAVRKKTKVFFLTPTKKIELRMACGLEKDVPGSEKREAEVPRRTHQVPPRPTKPDLGPT